MRRKRFILRHCDVRTSTPHSSGFARFASGAFYFVVSIMTFYEFIKNVPVANRDQSPDGAAILIVRSPVQIRMAAKMTLSVASGR